MRLWLNLPFDLNKLTNHRHADLHSYEWLGFQTPPSNPPALPPRNGDFLAEICLPRHQGARGSLNQSFPAATRQLAAKD